MSLDSPDFHYKRSMPTTPLARKNNQSIKSFICVPTPDQCSPNRPQPRVPEIIYPIKVKADQSLDSATYISVPISSKRATHKSQPTSDANQPIRLHWWLDYLASLTRFRKPSFFYDFTSLGLSTMQVTLMAFTHNPIQFSINLVIFRSVLYSTRREVPRPRYCIQVIRPLTYISILLCPTIGSQHVQPLSTLARSDLEALSITFITDLPFKFVSLATRFVLQSLFFPCCRGFLQIPLVILEGFCE